MKKVNLRVAVFASKGGALPDRSAKPLFVRDMYQVDLSEVDFSSMSETFRFLYQPINIVCCFDVTP